MTKIPSRALIGVILAALLIAVGCDREEQKKITIIPEEEVIAVVNNKKILLSTFQTNLQAFLKHYGQLAKTDDRQLQKIKDIVIEGLIEKELIAQEASRKGIRVPDEELENIAADQLQPYQGANFDQSLENQNHSVDEWKENLRLSLLRQKLIQQEVIDKIPITKREIQSYYQKHKRDIIQRRGYKVLNITLSTEEEAKAVHLQLKRRADFKELVRKHSISPDKLMDGEIGFVEKGDMPPELENAIFTLGFRNKRKRLSEVVHSQDGFHIFYLIKYRPRRRLSQISRQKAKSLIKDIFIEQKRDAAYAKWMNRLKREASISIDEAMLASEEEF